MRILILGGTGFIGPRVINALSQHDVTLFHRYAARTAPPVVRHICGHREDIFSHCSAFRSLQPDVVIDMIPQNGMDAQRVVDSFSGFAGRLVAISSGSVYRSFGVLIGTEPGPVDNRPASEEGALRERPYPYRRTRLRESDDPKRWLDYYDKIPAERVFLAQHNLPCSIIRLPMVYGPGDPDCRIAAYIERMHNNRFAISMQKTAARWRNSRAYVDNVAEAIARVVLQGSERRVYNVAEPQDFTEGEWVRRIGEQIGWKGVVRPVCDGSRSGRPEIDELPEETNFAQHLRMDSSRIRQELGYAEVIPVEEGLRRSVEGIHKD